MILIGCEKIDLICVNPSSSFLPTNDEAAGRAREDKRKYSEGKGFLKGEERNRFAMFFTVDKEKFIYLNYGKKK